MAKKLYTGINDTSRNSTKLYIGISDLSRKAKKAYIGVNNLSRLFWDNSVEEPMHVTFILNRASGNNQSGAVRIANEYINGYDYVYAKMIVQTPSTGWGNPPQISTSGVATDLVLNEEIKVSKNVGDPINVTGYYLFAQTAYTSSAKVEVLLWV